MATPIVQGLTLRDFFKIRAVYERKALARKAERLNAGAFDCTWDEQVKEEMLIDLLEQNTEIKRRLKVIEEAIFGDSKPLTTKG